MGLFALLEEEESAARLPIPKLPERSRAELMAMEKETTGIYISGHPMDDYRAMLQGTHVLRMGALMDEETPVQDDQIVSVAGIVQSMKLKTTRNNSSMAYVTVEDDTASVEMIAFSRVLEQYSGYLKENSAVVITGRVSLREDKEPQIVINRVRPISDFAREMPEPQPETPPMQELPGRLYLRLPSEGSPLYRKVRAIIQMFPGNGSAVLYFTDTGARRGARCAIAPVMLSELQHLLGEANVVLK